MAKIAKTSQTSNGRRSVQLGETRYIFKDASELPRSKPDYVVLSPTPLGLRAVPDREGARRSLRFMDRVRAIFRRNAIP